MGIREYTSAIASWSKSQADYIVSPATRKQYYDNTSAFAHEQPLLFSFLLIQLLLSFTPIALFLTFALGTLAFSLISVVLFSLFWIGAALLVLVPTLFITVSLGIVVWIWAVSSFLVARWVYNIVPVSVNGGAEVAIPDGKKVVVQKNGDGDFQTEVKDTY